MLIQSKGITTDTFFIPPFELNEGEIVVLYLYNGPHFFETELFLRDIFTGKTQSENVVIHKKMSFVEYFFEPKLRRTFCPITVGEFLKKKANFESPFASKNF